MPAKSASRRPVSGPERPTRGLGGLAIEPGTCESKTGRRDVPVILPVLLASDADQVSAPHPAGVGDRVSAPHRGDIETPSIATCPQGADHAEDCC